jgi:hypothetical protein
MNNQDISTRSAGQAAPDWQDGYNEFSAPVGSATTGRLVFASGAAGVTLQAGPTGPELCQAHFEQHIPNIWARDGVITIRYRDFSFFNWLVYWRNPVAQIKLNQALPWEIEFRDGLSKLIADLSAIQLRALDLCSASEVMIRLPKPSGTVFIHLSGSASDMVIHRPAGVPFRFNLGGSASNLRLDDRSFRAIAGGLSWQSSSYDATADRYDISISGSLSDVTINTRRN